MQGSSAFKKYWLQEKFILQQFVANFANFWWNNSIFMQKKNRSFKKYLSKVYILTMSNSANFRTNNCALKGKKCIKNISHLKNLYFEN